MVSNRCSLLAKFLFKVYHTNWEVPDRCYYPEANTKLFDQIFPGQMGSIANSTNDLVRKKVSLNCNDRKPKLHQMTLSSPESTENMKLSYL